MTKNWKEIAEAIGTTLGKIVANIFIVAAVAAVAYNNIIAWEFNLPQFDYWAFVLLRIAYLFWFGNVKSKKKEE